MATFTYDPIYSVNLTQSPRVRVAQFGDGYMQRSGDGINRQARTWSVKFSGTQSEIDVIDAFLTNEGGITSFDWTPPTGTSGKFLSQEWTVSAGDYNDWILSSTFNEVFGE